MQLGMIGLGRMGANMARRLIRGGHQCGVFDRNPDSVKQLVSEGAKGTSSLHEFASQLSKPRTAWIMVPAGSPTEQIVMTLAEMTEAGDAIIDGGNSHFKDDVRPAHVLEKKGIHYLGCGYERRYLGSGERLLPDDRRRGGSG